MNINNDVTSDTKKKNERTSSHKITCNREDNEKNVWEIATNEKWGNSNYIHENQTYLSHFEMNFYLFVYLNLLFEELTNSHLVHCPS
jgi:hypothetical protein